MKQHQLLHILNERQLDDTGAATLLSFHISLDERQGAGESLPAMVNRVRDAVIADPLAREELDSRLIDAGYLDAHAVRYSVRGFTLRQASFYRVGKAFPRIIDRDLRPGVGDVRYTIAVAGCQPFAVTDVEARSLWGEHA